MNPPIGDIREAIPEIGRMIAAALAQQRQPSPPEQVAIRAVWAAVDNTRMYLRRINQGLAVGSQPNPELIQLWSEASLQIAAFDPALALRLRDKADYWSDPQGWGEARIAQARIDIDLVADDARALLQLAVPKPPARTDDQATTSDVFISHASEDKATVAAPLAQELERRHVSVWLDRSMLTLGDNLTSEIDKGLRGCRYGAVILSNSFFAKGWPRNELNALMALESADGRKRILPIWHGLDQAGIALQSPLLAGRIGISTELGIPEIANAIQAAIVP